MNAPVAGRAPALDGWGITHGRITAPEALRGSAPEALSGTAAEALSGTTPEALRGPAADAVLVVGDGVFELPAVVGGWPAVDTLRSDELVRAQLPRRFGLVIIGPWMGERSHEWHRMLVHSAVAHLVPGGLLVADAAVGHAIEPIAGATGLDIGGELAEGHRWWRRTTRRTVHDLVAEARSRLDRMQAADLAAAMAADDHLVVLDTRTPTDRDRHGVIPGSVHAPRTVLEWLADPTSGYSHEAIGPDTRLVVVCNEGYSSSLAAANLQELGFTAATDLVGGVVAWLAAGLPTEAPEGHHGLCLLPEENRASGDTCR